MSKLLSRKRRPSLEPPPSPTAASLREAQEAAREAGETLDRIRSLDSVVNRQSARAEQIYRENHLGPSFWRALGEKRA